MISIPLFQHNYHTINIWITRNLNTSIISQIFRKCNVNIVSEKKYHNLCFNLVDLHIGDKHIDKLSVIDHEC